MDAHRQQTAQVTERYQHLVASQHIKPDAAQVAVAQKLDRLLDALARHKPNSWCGWFNNLVGRAIAAPRGIYLYGGVGRGKSMLMDMFFDLAPVSRKRRVHFHAFMQETHARIHAVRQAANVKGDPMPEIARQIARETQLICFDEFQVKDIADASILGRLFSLLLQAGIVVVATSNRPPDELYKGGLNRHRFLPFIDLLKTRLDCLALMAATDYRLARLQARPVWFTPLGAPARIALDDIFASLTEGVAAAPLDLELRGRTLHVPLAASGVARLDFAYLCAQPRGAADYLMLAAHFHTILIDNIPRFNASKRDQAVRFVTLIDALYEHKVKLVASAEGAPHTLYPNHKAIGDGAFEFERTASRLVEMQARDYLAREHIGRV